MLLDLAGNLLRSGSLTDSESSQTRPLSVIGPLLSGYYKQKEDHPGTSAVNSSPQLSSIIATPDGS